MAISYGAFTAIFFSLIALCSAIPFYLILCCDPPAAAGRRRGRLPGPQRPRPAPVVRVLVVRKPQQQHQLVYFSYPVAPNVEGGGGGTAGSSVVVCAICLEALVGGAECSEVPACRHVFHRGCLALWIKSNSTCPLCRELVVAVVPGSEPLSAAEAMV